MELLGVDDVYIDRISGKNTNRPELQKMMDLDSSVVILNRSYLYSKAFI